MYFTKHNSFSVTIIYTQRILKSSEVQSLKTYEDNIFELRQIIQTTCVILHFWLAQNNNTKRYHLLIIFFSLATNYTEYFVNARINMQVCYELPVNVNVTIIVSVYVSFCGHLRIRQKLFTFKLMQNCQELLANFM